MTEVKGLAEVLAEHEYALQLRGGAICICGFVPAMEPGALLTQQDYHRAHVEAAVLHWVRERLADAQYAMVQALPGLLVDEYGEDPATWSELGSTRRLASELSGIASEALGVGEVRG